MKIIKELFYHARLSYIYVDFSLAFGFDRGI